MKKKEYLIGDVAAMTGVSRDTLRFYEKKGIITVRKKENGYRYYSEDDIFELSSIFYHRKMNIGLDEIEHLWSGDASFETAAKVTQQQIEAEEQEILKHQQALIRLQLFQEECRKISQNLNKVSVRSLPKAYVIETCKTPQEGVIAWFCQSQKEPGLDMLYTYDFYTYDEQSEEDMMKFQNSSLLLYKELADCLSSSFNVSSYPMTGITDCLYTIVESHDRVPSSKTVRSMLNWGKEHDFYMGNHIVSDYIMHGMQGGTFTYYLEIYIPIIPA